MIDNNASGDSRLIDQHRFERLVLAISDYAIYMLDAEGHVASWNTGARRFKGYTAGEIVGQHFSRFYTAEDRTAGLPALALHSAETSGSYESEGWRLRKDGSRFWAHVVIDPIRAEDGRLLGFAKITRDITDKKAADEALRMSEQQFRMLVQGVTDYAIYMLDPAGRVTNWNTGAQRIKGYTETEIIGTHFSQFYTDEDRAVDMPARALMTVAKEGRFEQEGWRVRKDGTRFMAHVIIDQLHNGVGEFIGYAKITRDITEKHEAAIVLKRTEQALMQSQKMETIGKLTGGIAHDFNNLLQIISGNLQLLAREFAGNDRAERRLASAMGGVSRGAKLTNYLLAFGRRQALEPRVVNIGRLVFGMEDMLQRSLGETIDVETIVSGGLWNTFVDVAQVENALLNLSINARDAMQGSGKLTIEIGNAYLDDAYACVHSDVAAGQYVVLAVTDTGTGMPQEVIAHAFEPFFSTKSEGKGTGLGLSMVYGFVKQSGGHVKIYSEIGLGTTIKLYLPRSLDPEDVIAPKDTQKVVGGSETILVAEDDEEVCATAVAMLTELGYQVLKANDAAAALTIIKSGMKIDLLFTDVVMPGPMRSPDLARKTREYSPDTAVLFTSGYTQNAIVHGGRLDPGVELLGKPYNREDLARKVRHVIAHHKQRRHADTAADADKTKATAIPPLLGGRTLSILLVEDDPAIRENTAELLKDLGHRVMQASDAREATSVIASVGKTGVDVLMTDIGLKGTSGEALAKQVRAIIPEVGVVFATGQDGPLEILNSSLLRKPYNISSIATVLSKFSEVADQYRGIQKKDVP